MEQHINTKSPNSNRRVFIASLNISQDNRQCKAMEAAKPASEIHHQFFILPIFLFVSTIIQITVKTLRPLTHSARIIQNNPYFFFTSIIESQILEKKTFRLPESKTRTPIHVRPSYIRRNTQSMNHHDQDSLP